MLNQNLWGNMLPDATMAEGFALALERGLVSPDDIVAWADSRVAEQEHPHHTVIDVSLLSADTSRMLAKLREVPGVRDHSQA
ncbi:MAG: hypothetical protein AAF581_03150 [Planctomycetota bacterium]